MPPTPSMGASHPARVLCHSLGGRHHSTEDFPPQPGKTVSFPRFTAPSTTRPLTSKVLSHAQECSHAPLSPLPALHACHLSALLGLHTWCLSYSGSNPRVRSVEGTWFLTFNPPSANPVTLGKSHDLPPPQFPYSLSRVFAQGVYTGECKAQFLAYRTCFTNVSSFPSSFLDKKPVEEGPQAL